MNNKGLGGISGIPSLLFLQWLAKEDISLMWWKIKSFMQIARIGIVVIKVQRSRSSESVRNRGKQGKERKGEKGDAARNAGELEKLHSSRQNKRWWIITSDPKETSARRAVPVFLEIRRHQPNSFCKGSKKAQKISLSHVISVGGGRLTPTFSSITSNPNLRFSAILDIGFC